MDAVFVELAPFRRHRLGYLDDDAYRSLQQFWLFTLYDKDEASDLTAAQRTALKRMLNREIEARRGL
jgi:hypothetical protein|tara:strand:+ start:150 stop:350 length:201 start_codon:yes stop_codon:yes gene_type:complete